MKQVGIIEVPLEWIDNVTILGLLKTVNWIKEKNNEVICTKKIMLETDADWCKEVEEGLTAPNYLVNLYMDQFGAVRIEFLLSQSGGWSMSTEVKALLNSMDKNKHGIHKGIFRVSRAVVENEGLIVRNLWKEFISSVKIIRMADIDWEDCFDVYCVSHLMPSVSPTAPMPRYVVEFTKNSETGKVTWKFTDEDEFNRISSNITIDIDISGLDKLKEVKNGKD